MKFPKGVRRSEPPKRSRHRGATWDFWDVILPNGHVVNGHLDTSWGVNFFFEHEGVWRRGRIDDFKIEVGRSAHIDLRDQQALAAAETKIAEYEEAIHSGDKPRIERLCEEVETAATAAGYNDHRRLAAIHTWAEREELA